MQLQEHGVWWRWLFQGLTQAEVLLPNEGDQTSPLTIGASEAASQLNAEEVQVGGFCHIPQSVRMTDHEPT